MQLLQGSMRIVMPNSRGVTRGVVPRNFRSSHAAYTAVSRRRMRLIMATAQDAAPAATAASPITLTDKALTQLRKLQAENPDGEKLLLRMGVKNGGCNGMSYVMDFEKEDNIASDDNVMEVEGFRLVCCNKSLLYLFGLQLDYSDALVGGGFNFQNPNSKGECGCGKSFSV